MQKYSQKIILLIFLIINQNIISNNYPKISIITSIYKGKNFIKGFLENITKQTIFNQCELILIDANSPENEKEIIDQYLKKYKNIFYYRLDETVTIYKAWNIAIAKSKGQYITNANIDDRLFAKCYEIHSKTLDNDKKIDLVYSDSYISKIANQTFICSTYTTHKPQFSKIHLKYNCLPSCNPMWRKSLHEKFGLFDENFKIAGDWDFWIRIAKNGVIFKKINEILGVFYVNPTGLSKSHKNQILLKHENETVKKKHPEFFK